MLIHLSISNFAIIEHAEIAPGHGLTIVSGETGAGKSVIINAINLILGGRASTELIRSGAEEASVEALFALPKNQDADRLLKEMGLPFDGELLIRRTIFREGRNRIFINGAMATLNMLSALGPTLVSISGQHEHQVLLKPDNHLYILDDYAGLTIERLLLNRRINEYRALQRQAADLAADLRLMEAQQDLSRFQLEEIEKAALKPSEEEELQQTRRRLQNADELLRITEGIYQDIYENQESLLGVLSRCRKRLERGTQIDSGLSPLLQVLLDLEAKLADVAIALRDFRNGVPMEPENLDQVMERLQLINRLKRKYGPTVKDVLLRADALAAASFDLEQKRLEIGCILKTSEALRADILQEASALSLKRRAAAAGMESQMEKELQLLHMGRTRFRVAFHPPGSNLTGPEAPPEEIRSDGLDQIEFLMAPNAGEGLRPLAKIASGGELSRIMLALKTLLAKSASVETLIFDEVDAGISGATAEIVGDKITALSQFHQIICITHLPQIASKGGTHFLVRKEFAGERTQTNIVRLNAENRLKEIARLLAGKEITPRALAHAEEMLR